MQWLIFSFIFKRKSDLMISIESLERIVAGQKHQIDIITAENKELLLKEKAYERMKEVFIKHGDSFFFAQYTTKNKFAIVGLDKKRQMIKIWGEYSETEHGKLEEDCNLEYKTRTPNNGEKSMHIEFVRSTTKREGYCALAIDALKELAKAENLNLLTGNLPEENDNSERIKIYKRMGFRMKLNEDKNTGSFYTRI